jgi:two-component sensor histidine kinase/tetratricopeptide (TPR) repeat protein
MKVTYNCVFILLILSHLGFAQNDDSIRIHYCENILSKTTLIEEDFQKLDSVLFQINYYQSSTPIELYHRAIHKANQSDGLKKYAGIFEVKLSDLYWEYENLDSSTYYIERAVSRFELLDEELEYARTANVRRQLKVSDSDFLSAYDVCFEALEIFQKYGDIAGTGIAYRDIGSIMINEEKYSDALVYCSKSVEALESIDYWYELNFSYQRMAIIYRNLGDFEKSHSFIQKAIDACYRLEGFRVNQGISKLYWTRGYIYEAENKFDQAIAYIDSAYYLAKQVDLSFDRWIFDSKGRIYLKQQKYQEALTEFNQELDVLNSNEEGKRSYDFYNPIFSNLSEAYAGLGQYEQAYILTKKMAVAKDSTFKLESEKQISELQTKYETVKKEARILSLEADKIVQRQFLIIVIILLTTFAGMMILLFRNNRYRSRANQTLQVQKKEIELKNEQNELLLKEIHHRVKNNLQTVSSLLSLQSESISDPSAFDAVQESKNRVASMALIHQKLYQGENLAAVEMRDYFETIGKAIIDSFGERAKNISFEVNMSEIELDVDTAVPVGLITNELITNSIKHAFPNKQKGQILITFAQEENGLLKLTIADNGQPTNTEEIVNKNKGFGTLLIQLLTTQLGGKLEKSNEAGTSTMIQFPPQEKSVA